MIDGMLNQKEIMITIPTNYRALKDAIAPLKISGTVLINKQNEISYTQEEVASIRQWLLDRSQKRL